MFEKLAFSANAFTRYSVEQAITEILHLHLEDIRGKKHYHRMPGTGDINFVKGRS